MKRLALALAFVAAIASTAVAHVVPTGVGSQSEIHVSPRRIVVKFNMGFSNLLGMREMKLMDTNHDAEIDRGEQEAYLSRLGPKLVEKLRCHLDGQPVTFRIVRHRATGILGPIEAVQFDTWFDLEAEVAIGPGRHALKFYEGNYEGEDAQQVLWLPLDRPEDWKEFTFEQESKVSPPIERENLWQLGGRDVTLTFAFDPKALERDRAEALLEPAMRGLSASVEALAGSVARAVADDASVLAFEPMLLGHDERLLVDSPLTQIGAGLLPTAPDRVATPGFTPTPSTSAEPAKPTIAELQREERAKQAEANDTEEFQKLRDVTKSPISIATLLVVLVLGMWHAMGAGHGKTMVAAYLLGTAGRVWDAVRLGLIVTFTHTFTLYTFGLGIVYGVERFKLGSPQVIQNRAIFYLTLASGLGLVFFGLGLARRRMKSLRRAEELEAAKPAAPPPAPPATGKRLALVASAPVEAAPHAHDHDHAHDHSHAHDHDHSHDHAHGHSHDHDGMSDEEHGRLHAEEASREVSSWRDLVSLGLSGGIVPCPAGIGLILFSLSFPKENTLRCFVYLVAFSLGLGLVLVAIATAMVFSRPFLQSALESRGRRRALLWLPVVSAVLVSFVGWSIVYEAFDPGFKKLKARVLASK